MLVGSHAVVEETPSAAAAASQSPKLVMAVGLYLANDGSGGVYGGCERGARQREDELQVRARHYPHRGLRSKRTTATLRRR